ncbi:unnamed protein product, partial [Nesidiocoris tenuis]
CEILENYSEEERGQTSYTIPETLGKELFRQFFFLELPTGRSDQPLCRTEESRTLRTYRRNLGSKTSCNPLVGHEQLLEIPTKQCHYDMSLMPGEYEYIRIHGGELRDQIQLQDQTQLRDQSQLRDQNHIRFQTQLRDQIRLRVQTQLRDQIQL